MFNNQIDKNIDLEPIYIDISQPAYFLKILGVVMVNSNLKQPCIECPFRRSSAPGWLGPWTSENLIEEVETGTFVCHRSINDLLKYDESKLEYCAGAGIYLNNHFKLSRNNEYSEYQKALKNISVEIQRSVFSRKDEFTEHHNKLGIVSGALVRDNLSDDIECPIGLCQGCLLCADIGCRNCNCNCNCNCEGDCDCVG